MDENVKEVRTHRVGSITLGSALVLFGILFLVHLFVPVLTYEIIFHIWPCSRQISTCTFKNAALRMYL